MATYFRFDSAIRAFLEGELDTREVVGLLREAAALAKRYEDAPVVECYRHPQLGPFIECRDEHFGCHFRLVAEEE